MKQLVRGRTIGVLLAAGSGQVASQLSSRGFEQERASEVADAARMFAEDEADYLSRKLVPRNAWPGSTVIRRYVGRDRESCWLMLSFEQVHGWRLDAVLVD